MSLLRHLDQGQGRFLTREHFSAVPLLVKEDDLVLSGAAVIAVAEGGGSFDRRVGKIDGIAKLGIEVVGTVDYYDVGEWRTAVIPLVVAVAVAVGWPAEIALEACSVSPVTDRQEAAGGARPWRGAAEERSLEGASRNWDKPRYFPSYQTESPALRSSPD